MCYDDGIECILLYCIQQNTDNTTIDTITTLALANILMNCTSTSSLQLTEIVTARDSETWDTSPLLTEEHKS